ALIRFLRDQFAEMLDIVPRNKPVDHGGARPRFAAPLCSEANRGLNSGLGSRDPRNRGSTVRRPAGRPNTEAGPPFGLPSPARKPTSAALAVVTGAAAPAAGMWAARGSPHPHQTTP